MMGLPSSATIEEMPKSSQRFNNRWPVRFYRWFGRFGYPLWERHTHLYQTAYDMLAISYFVRKLDDPHNWCWSSNCSYMEFSRNRIDDWTRSGVFDSYKASTAFPYSFKTCGDVDSFVSVIDALISNPGPGRWSLHFDVAERCSPRNRNLELAVQNGNFEWMFEQESRALMVKLSATVNPPY